MNLKLYLQLNDTNRAAPLLNVKSLYWRGGTVENP